MDNFQALWAEISGSPASLLVIVLISIVCLVLEGIPQFPNRYNWTIPLLCVVLGSVLYPVFADRSAIPKTYPHPLAVVVAIGFIGGFVASIAHVTLGKFIVSKAQSLLPQSQPTNPDK